MGIMSRRNFLKFAGMCGATAAGTTLAASENPIKPKKEFVGVLSDTTRCIGCRSCEKACAEAHDLPIPDIENDNALTRMRSTSETQWTLVNKFETSKGPVYVKKQCMHCWQPACTSACLTNAMFKTIDGPVIWRGEKCMGCRFCMVACPFVIPKFEYNSWNPRVQKCNMCWDRLEKGKKPACVQACPTDSLMFGMKKDIMEVARTRVYKHPTRYVRHIYGEYEVGGTGWVYLASVPFNQLGFRTDLGTTPFPEYTKEFLYAVPGIDIVVPALLFGLHVLSSKGEKGEKDDIENS